MGNFGLEEAGLHVIPQYGTSGFRIDFAVPHPTISGRMVLAIEADGASYHALATARDRDRLRQQVLEQFGWRFHRVWSTDWFNDPQAETAKVLASYERALDEIANEDRVELHDDQGDVGVVWLHETPNQRGPRPGVWPGGTVTDYSHSQLVALARWIKSDTLLRTEEQLIDEIMDELGFRRRGRRIVAALRRAIREA